MEHYTGFYRPAVSPFPRDCPRPLWGKHLHFSKWNRTAFGFWSVQFFFEDVCAKYIVSQTRLTKAITIGHQCGQGFATSHSLNPCCFAPEVVQQKEAISQHVDVWSFAVACPEPLTCEQLFSDVPRDFMVVRELGKGKTPKYPSRHVTNQGLTDELWCLMQECWHQKLDQGHQWQRLNTSFKDFAKLLPSLKVLWTPYTVPPLTLKVILPRHLPQKPNDPVFCGAHPRLTVAQHRPPNHYLAVLGGLANVKLTSQQNA